MCISIFIGFPHCLQSNVNCSIILYHPLENSKDRQHLLLVASFLLSVWLDTKDTSHNYSVSFFCTLLQLPLGTSFRCNLLCKFSYEVCVVISNYSSINFFAINIFSRVEIYKVFVDRSYCSWNLTDD